LGPSSGRPASCRAARFGTGFQRPSFNEFHSNRAGVSCFWRLLIFAGWPRRTPFSGAENSPIAFICELKKQVRIGLVLLGKGQSAISDRAGGAHGHLKSQRNRTRIQAQEEDLVPGRPLACDAIASQPQILSLAPAQGGGFFHRDSFGQKYLLVMGAGLPMRKT
jgi:hypothetical protein